MISVFSSRLSRLSITLSIRVAVFSTEVGSSDIVSTLISSTTISSESFSRTSGSGSISVENSSSSASSLALSSTGFGCSYSSGGCSGGHVTSGFVISLNVGIAYFRRFTPNNWIFPSHGGH